MKCLIIDDDPLVCDLLAYFCSKTAEIDQVTVTNSGFESVNLIDQGNFDLILLDFHLPDITGREILGLLPEGISVVMITSNKDFGHESYNYAQVVDFLLKPIEYPRFAKAIEKVRGTRQIVPHATAQKSIFIKDGQSLVKVEFDKVLFVKSAGNYVEIHQTSGRTMTLMPLKEFAKQLPSQFQQVHRSHIVHTGHVTRIDKEEVTVGGLTIPLSATYYEALLEKVSFI